MRRDEQVIACEDEDGRPYEVTLWREWYEERQLGGCREVAGHYMAEAEGPDGPRRLDILSPFDKFRLRDTGQVIWRVGAG